MIADLHRWTGYWLSSPADARRSRDDADERARAHLERIRAAVAPWTNEQGHITPGFEPSRMPDNPGYAWLRARLLEMKAREPDFDDVPAPPEPECKPVYEEWDPFPAFFWRATDSTGTRGLLEVLVGRDTVVLHQSAARLTEGAGLEERWNELRESVWLADGAAEPRETGQPADGAVDGRLFTAEILHVSPTPEASTSDESWAELCLERMGRHASNVVFAADPAVYELRLGLDSIASRARFEGALRLLRTLRGGRDDAWKNHTDAGRLLTRLCTAFVNARKVAFEHDQALRLFRGLKKDQEGARARLEELRRERHHVLAPPLSYAEVNELRGLHQRARKLFEDADRLVFTCRWNVNQLMDVGDELLPGHPWARAALIHVRRLLDQIDSEYQASRRRVEALTADIELEITAGTRAVTAAHAGELVRFGGNRSPRPEGFVPVLVSGADEQTPRGPTPWLAPRGRPCEVLRPLDLGPEQLDDLRALYRGVMHDASAQQLADLVGALCDPSASLQLAPEREGDPAVELPLGRIIDGKPEDAAALVTRLPSSTPGRFLACSGVYAQATQDARADGAAGQEHWEALASLLAFLDAVTGFLARPAEHLAGAAERYAARRIRLVTVAGLVRLVAGEAERGWQCLQDAAQAAMARQDFEWAYFVARVLSEAERRGVHGRPAPAPHAMPAPAPDAPPAPADGDPAPAARESSETEWRVRLGREFLGVFDLASATHIAGSPAGRAFGQPRYGARRASLWGWALAVGATLLGSDWAMTHSSHATTWGPEILHGAAVVALLGAPVALAVIGLHAARRLFPDILYPRIFGAVTIAVLTFGTTDQTATILALSGLTISLPLALIAIAGGFTYLYHEVRTRVADRNARMSRCGDMFALVFLEAVSVTTIVLLAYQRLFQQIYTEADKQRAASFTSGELFFRPGSVFLIAVVSLFAGIVLQLMFELGDAGARARPHPDTGHAGHAA